jgi:O-antigen/teichoic acid export membrane protein
LKKTIYVNYLVQLCAVATNLVFTLLIVHELGATGYGEYSLFFNSLAFSILLLGFNLPAIVIFFIANKKIDASKLLTSGLLFISAASLALSLLLSFSKELGFATAIFPNGDPKSIWIFFFAAQFFLLQVNGLLAAFLNAHKIFLPVSLTSFCCNLLLLFFWFLLSSGSVSFRESNFNLIWWSSIGCNSVILIFYLYLAFARVGVIGKSGIISRVNLGQIAGFAFIVYLCNTIQFLNYKMDIYFVNHYGIKQDVGIYSLALSLSQLVWILPNTVTGIVVNYLEVNKRQQSIGYAMDYASPIFYSSLLISILLFIAYYFLLPVVYGSDFTAALDLCLILFFGAIPFTLSIMIAALNSAIGFVRLNLYATLFAFFLGFTLDLLFIPLFGLIGAAWAKVIMYIGGLAYQMYLGKRFYNLVPGDLFRLPKRQDMQAFLKNL